MMIAAVTAATIAVAAPAQAAEIKPFSARAFTIAQQQGRPILVDVYADWCPTCRAQAPSIDRLARSLWAAKMIVFRLNFDTQKADWSRMGVRRQSTLIAYRGYKETGRLVGATDPALIEKLMHTPIA